MAQRQFRSDDTSSWGEKFGNGSDGALTISSNTTFSATNEGCSGTSGTTALTLASAGSFSNGDLVLIHQSRGTGVGNWELNKISSGGGTTSLTMSYDLTNTYTDSGSSQAQIVKLFQYSSVTVNSGITWSAPTWDGSKGGILAFLCNGITSIAGNINATGDGFAGGQLQNDNSNGYRGENTLGASVRATSASGNGGGGGGGGTTGNPGTDGGGGGGGGNANSGSNGVGVGGYVGGAGGGTSGNAGLTLITFGGAGGGGGDLPGSIGQAGGRGGGVVILISKTTTITGSISTSGVTGDTAGSYPAGGGGAGGSILLKSETATLGSSLVTASAGSGGNGTGPDGGAGSVGRIHLDYATSYTGTTSPTLDVTQDTSLLSANSGIFLSF